MCFICNVQILLIFSPLLVNKIGLLIVMHTYLY